MWSTTMAHADIFVHNPDSIDEIDPLGWNGAAENIAWASWGGSGMGKQFHTQWWNSPGHKTNMLGDYTHVGIGIHTAPDGSTYGTQVFANLDDDSLPTPSLAGFGGATKATVGTSLDVSLKAGAAGRLERLTSDGWVATGTPIPSGTSVVRVPAPTKVGATSIFRITLPATDGTAPTWSPTLALTAQAKPSRLASSTWPTKARNVTLGKGVNATAKVRAGDWVLERRNPGSKTWVTVRSGKATGTTSLSLALKPTKAGTSTFRLRLPATASTSARTLTVKVTARRASTAKVTASRTVAKPGAKITLRTKVSTRARLEQSTGGAWRKVATVPAGSSKVTVRAGKAGTTVRYRVVVPRTTTVTGATSKTVKVVVKR